MATAQHPVPARTAGHHHFDWLWIGLSVVLVALIAGAVAWTIFRPAVTVPPLPAEVVGFEYNQEATVGHIAQQPGVTSQYFGHSGELYPEVVAARVTDPGEAASLIRSVDRAIAVSHLAMLGGLELDHEMTPIQVSKPGVISQYFGSSGELFPDE